jgi:hypothetical protein
MDKEGAFAEGGPGPVIQAGDLKKLVKGPGADNKGAGSFTGNQFVPPAGGKIEYGSTGPLFFHTMDSHIDNAHKHPFLKKFLLYCIL